MRFLLSGEIFPLLLVLLAAAMVSQTLGRRLRAPATVLMLGIGMVAGLTLPGVFPDLLRTLASVGLAYVFFLVGCEVEMTRVLRANPVAWLFAGAGFASALVLGWIIGTRALGLGFVDSLLLGVAFSAASPFPRQLGPRFERMAGRQGFSLLGANDLGEVLRFSAFMVLLACRVPGHAGYSVVAVIMVLAAAGASFWICSLLPSLWFGRTEDSANLGFSVLAGCGFAAAALAGLVGLPPPLGALAAGLALGRYEPQGSVLDERLGFAARSIFLPLAVVPVGIAVALAPLALASHAALPSSISSIGAALLACCFVVGPRLAAALSVLPLIPLGRWFHFFAMAAAPGAEASTLLYILLVAGLGILGPQESVFLVAAFAASWILEFLGGAESIETRRRLPAVSTGSETKPRRDRREGSSAEILVALSNPATAQGLLWIGIHVRAQASFERIRALVVCESPESERELERAEYLIAQALVKARDAEGLIEPAIAMAPSVAEGILKAAAQGPARAIILGWNNAPHPSSLFASGIHEAILDGTDSLLVVARPGPGFNGIDRLALVLPPGIEGRLDASRIAGSLTPILAATGATLTVYVQKPGGPAARTLAGIARPRGSIEIEELDSWKSAARVAKSRSRGAAGRTTGYAILSGRQGQPIWHPSFEILPGEFAASFPGSPLMILYPPAVAEGGGGEGSPQGLLNQALDNGRVRLRLQESQLPEAIKRLLSADFAKDRREQARLTGLFSEIAQHEPIELEPGVLLLHAHIGGIEEALVYFGSRSPGWRIRSLAEPAKVLVILCEPEGLSPGRHLATLGELSRLFRDRGLGFLLAQAEDPEELRRALPIS